MKYDNTMKTRLLLLLLLISMTVSAQWTEQMYAQYTYENYTDYAAFNQPVEPQTLDVELLEAAIFYETNRQRAAYGVAQLQFDAALHICARNHSVDMVEHNFFSHTSVVAGKERMSDRLARVGYTNCASAENILYSPVKESYAATAKYLVGDIWMNSAGHRQNILTAEYTHLGAGVALYFDRTWLMVKATQNFIKKRR